MLKKNSWLIFVISFLFLFFELLIIRLVSTEIRIFAYISNLVLLAIFFGSGLGMIFKNKKKYSLSYTVVFLFIIACILVLKFIVRFPNLEFNLFSGVTEMLAPLSEAHIWGQVNTYSLTGVAIGVVLTVFIFFVISFAFVPIGGFLGDKLDKSKRPILAYSLNIVASLLGMWAFHLFSVGGLSPFFGLFLGQLILLLLIKNKTLKTLALAAVMSTVVLILPREAHQPGSRPVTYWSPYQKLSLGLLQQVKPYQAEGWKLEVNNVNYMALLDLSEEEFLKREEAVEKHLGDEYKEIEFLNQYSLPFRFKSKPKDVLIIGGGAGNDAAAALKADAQNITVVEIDPVIVSLGKKYHPEKPYEKDNIDIFVNDGRAFLETTNKKYDLVIMSLADSHTLTSSLTNLRLDNYLYTFESLKKVKDVLKNDGLMFLSFEVNRPWIGDRIKKTVYDVFGYDPKIFEVRSDGIFGWGGYFFVVSKSKNTLDNILKKNSSLAAFIEKKEADFNKNTNKLTDDWPYLYLDKPRLPLIHILVSLILLGSLFVFRDRLIKERKLNLTFFVLGAGFMLFEFQNISKSSLIFGNTWMTNLFIVTGVLIFVLAANLAAYKKFLNFKQAFILLLLSLLANFIVPIGFFNSFSGINKLVFSTLFLTAPHFFSGLIFVSFFKKVKDKSLAFGSNFLGSVLGGLLEMFSFLLGINTLLLLVVFFYSLGFVFAKKSKLV
jgi:spermidine synthase